MIVDRGGEHYDLALTRRGYQPSAVDAVAGQKAFGHLRMSSVDQSLVPEAINRIDTDRPWFLSEGGVWRDLEREELDPSQSR